MRAATSRLKRTTIAIVLTAMVSAMMPVTQALAVTTPVQIYTSSFDAGPPVSDPASGWTAGEVSTRSATTWGESSYIARTGTKSLWCAGDNAWQTVRDYYSFNNDEDGLPPDGGDNDPVDHYHGGVMVSAQGINGAASSDSWVDVDYFYFYNGDTDIAERVEAESGDPRITRSGSWEETTDARYSGGKAMVSRGPSTTLAFRAQGSLPTTDLATFEVDYASGHVTNNRGKAGVYHAYLNLNNWNWVRNLDLSTIPATYSNYMDGVVSRDVTLSPGYTSANVSFWYRIPSNEPYNQMDFGIFEVSTDGGAHWQNPYSYNGATLQTWAQDTRSLNSYLPGPGQPEKVIKVRWRWHSNNTATYEGMYIDDVSIDAVYDSAAGDTTPPSAVTVTAPSTTTSLTAVHANWTASADPESGVSEYQYSMGTSAGATDVKAWTSAGSATDATAAISPRLEPGVNYYFNVRAKNGAGLYGTVGSSAAIKAMALTAITCATNKTLVTYPGSITLSGDLTSTNPTVQALWASVQVQRKYPGETVWTTVASGIPSNNPVTGHYSYTLIPSRNAYYRTRFLTSGKYLGCASAYVSVNVAQTVTLAPTGTTTIPRYGTVTFTGHVHPHRASKGITIVYKYGTNWVTLATGATNASSNYSIPRTFNNRGTFYIRSTSPADSLNAAGTSPGYIKVVVT